MDGTPNARHVVTQFPENAETKMNSGTNHNVANAATLVPRII